MKFPKRINKYHIPSLFTLTNLFFGFLAVISIAEGYVLRAAYLIIAAGIFDVLDGKLARWIRSPSQFGTELDSLADMVSFCLAPALLIWSLYTQDLHPVLAALIAGAPLYFGALRLAKYNVNQQINPRPYFDGLPSPMNAMVVVALVFYYTEYNYAGAAKVVLPVVMATSFLMVSPIRYPKSPRLSFQGGWGNSAFLLGIIGLVISGVLWGAWVLLPGVALYIVGGLVRWLTRAYSVVDLGSVEKKI
ncbi:MAG: CDP-diacylglycerol--serine O-phosphatidyltransferase [Fidelibacterota bacterium]|nr:MAG: CDP-diacylglycerol--serine O-phosphatidyltransferase [Candidatus Neomarinimicrobiota bacterium]